MRWHMPVKMLIVVCFVFARGSLPLVLQIETGIYSTTLPGRT